MSDDTSIPTGPYSRRRVLRNGALAATIGAVGIPTVSGPAAASNKCPRSPGFWKNNWVSKLPDEISIPPAGITTKAEIQAFLRAPPRGDTVNIMATHYIATYLNLLLRPNPDTNCANRAVEVDGIGRVEWENVKNAAQRWLLDHGWDGTLQEGQKSWSPTVSVVGAPGTVNGETLKNALDAFNNNRFSALDCDCGGDNSESDSAEKENEDEQKHQGGDKAKGPPDHAGPSNRPEHAGPSTRPDHAGPPNQPNDAGPSNRPDHAGPSNSPSDAGPSNRPDHAGPPN